MYEAYYLGLLLQGKRAEIPDGHVIRVGGEKYMHLRVRAEHACAGQLEMERALAAALTLYTPHTPPLALTPSSSRSWAARRTLRKSRTLMAMRRRTM